MVSTVLTSSVQTLTTFIGPYRPPTPCVKALEGICGTKKKKNPLCPHQSISRMAEKPRQQPINVCYPQPPTLAAARATIIYRLLALSAPAISSRTFIQRVLASASVLPSDARRLISPLLGVDLVGCEGANGKFVRFRKRRFACPRIEPQ